ncbi:50S ribosomal protein L22 [Candidatus Daviesbacteria bacterium]|nr:50S ribosomal protein L22 [Candidatus Daviesbacteria bacterium]
MEYKHTQKNVGHSPRKLRLVADMIRKLNPDRALDLLQFTNRAAAQDLAKAIKTALANAGRKENLTFKAIEINEGSKMKRYRVGTAGRGRGRPYKKRLSHIRIVLTDEVDIKNVKEKGGIGSEVVLADSAEKSESKTESTSELAK